MFVKMFEHVSNKIRRKSRKTLSGMQEKKSVPAHRGGLPGAYASELPEA